MKPNWRDVAEGLEAALELQRRELGDALGSCRAADTWPALLASVRREVQLSIRNANEAHHLRRELEPLKRAEQKRAERRKERAQEAERKGSGMVEIVRAAHPTGHLQSRQELREWLQDYFRRNRP